MVDPFAIVTFAQLFPDQPGHHALNPLLANDGVLSSFQLICIVVVDPIKSGRHFGLLGEKSSRFWGGHNGLMLLLALEQALQGGYTALRRKCRGGYRRSGSGRRGYLEEL